jgi:hypothetical protein
MNFHTDEWIMDRVREHYNEALEHFPEYRIVGVYYQGSGNYGLDYPDSDVDTKCIVLPSIKQLCNNQQMSTTHIRKNDEHIDFKDIRIMFETFTKQNLNFLEILYTKYCVINPLYASLWDDIMSKRDDIVNMNNVSLVKSMKGIAGEKYHAMEHRYPSRIEWLDKFSYDPKQLHHLFRIKEFMCRWIDGEPFEKCLVSCEPEWLIDVKKGKYNLDDARHLGKGAMDYIQRKYDDYLKTCSYESNTSIFGFLDDISYRMIKIGIGKELETNV